MTVLEKIELLMTEKNLNKRQLSMDSKIPYSTISNLWVRGSDSMRLPTFRAICDYFKVTMDSMAYDENEIVYREDVEMPEISPTERDMIYSFRYLEEDARTRILASLELERAQEHEKKKVVSAS